MLFVSLSHFVVVGYVVFVVCRALSVRRLMLHKRNRVSLIGNAAGCADDTISSYFGKNRLAYFGV